MQFNRTFRYLILRLLRLRGHPHELALGMALGIFIGMTPTIPFHTVLSLSLALTFKASKITAACGSWICNPLTIYYVYKYSYTTGSFILGFNHQTTLLGSVIEAVNHGEFFHIITTILGGGGMVALAFMLGGIVLGFLFAVPSYFIFRYFFKAFISWRKSRKPIKA